MNSVKFFRNNGTAARRLRVLHIANWYPSEANPVEGIFIKQHIQLLNEEAEGEVVHLSVGKGQHFLTKREIAISDWERSIEVKTSIKLFDIVRDLIVTLLLLGVLLKRQSKFDVVNVHIAYPLLSFYFIWKHFIRKPIVITEHWSAYHLHFGLPPDKRWKLRRIRRIFRQRLPVIAVSNALSEDIARFAGSCAPTFQRHVVPNALDTDTFVWHSEPRRNGPARLFIVNYWKDIKNPFPMLEAFSSLVAAGEDLILTLGGYGPLMPKLHVFIEERSLHSSIRLSGQMTAQDIAAVLAESDAYLITSNYETFSVACAQALCCGVPLIGPPIPAIREYACDLDMVAVAGNTPHGWHEAFVAFLARRESFDRKAISERAHSRFSRDLTRGAYLSALLEAAEGCAS